MCSRGGESRGGRSLHTTAISTLGHGIGEELAEVEQGSRVDDQGFQFGAIFLDLLLVFTEQSIENKVGEEQGPFTFNVLKDLELLSIVMEAGSVWKEVVKSS
jgi:hypothetical protein